MAPLETVPGWVLIIQWFFLFDHIKPKIILHLKIQGSRLQSQHFGRLRQGGSRGQEIETILVNMVKPRLY